MTTKRYAKQTLLDAINKSKKLSNGCLIYPYSSSIDVLYHGEPTYLIRAIFDFSGKTYNGKIVRSCGNLKCICPDHLYSPTKEEKFWSNVWIGNDDECWEWKSVSGTFEYGETHFNGVRGSTHRLAWTLTYGEIPERLQVCHHCDNPPCCNPKHLFLGTRQDNVDDRERKGRNKMPHSLGEDHGHHKLTEIQVKEIRMLYSIGDTTYRKLSDLYGVTFGQIRNVIKRRAWGWLD